MKRIISLIIVLMFCAGCQVEQSLSSRLLTPTENWITKYGDSEKSKLYYTVAMLMAVSDQNAAVINKNSEALRKELPTTNPGK